MKKYILLFIFVCTTVLNIGQTFRTAADSPVLQYPDKVLNNEINAAKGGGDIIWETSFNWENTADPKGWTLPQGWTIRDNFDLGNLWVWRDDTIKGNYTFVTAPGWFSTASDGFICMPIDEYNSRGGITGSTPANSYIETPPINCSAVSSVVVRFNQYFRFCCRDYNLDMMVTTNGGANWVTYDAKFGVSGNTFTPEKYHSVEINISDVAAGMPNVQIRFYMHGPKSYFWMIDDLRLTEAFQNDLVLEYSRVDFDNGTDSLAGHINYWPLSQMGITGENSGTVGNNYFSGALLNNGWADAVNAKLEVKILKNGTLIHTDQSPGLTLNSLGRDTQKINNPYLANDFGDYRFDFSAISSNPEEVPADNSVSLYFTVNDTLAHRADFSGESSSNTSGWEDGNNKGDMVGVSYDLPAASEINSITAYIAGFEASHHPQFQFVLMKDFDGQYEEWITSDIIVMDSTYRHRWVTLAVNKDGETEFLQPGNYAACVRMWGTDPEDPVHGSNGLSVGWDLTTKPSNTLMYLTSLGAWYKSGKLNQIGLNISASGAPAHAPATFNVDMNKHILFGDFKPGTDFIDVAGSFNNWTGSAHLTDPESDGIYTLTIEGMPVGKVIEYKYRINGNWNTSEFPYGGPNRKYKVRYWNILNDVYNNGSTSAINQESRTASLKIYPNPSSGSFTLEVFNTLAVSNDITITDISGQVLYFNKTAPTLLHNQTFELNLAKGIYFISVNNGKEINIRKVIIQ